MTNQDRIKKIKNDNKELLGKSKEELNNNSEEFQSIVTKVTDEIKAHTDNAKKIKTYSKVNELILSLSNEINNCDDVEKIMKLRNRLNYYINKVRKELEKREFVTLNICKYRDASTEYRKSIAKNIRYLKRINNIDEIERLNSNFDNLSEEELLSLKKIIKKEQDYNSRNLKKYKPANDKFSFLNVINLKVNEHAKKLFEDNYHDKVNKDIERIRQQYRLNPLPEYDKCVGANVFTLVRNLPSYLKNKRILSVINNDDEEYDDNILSGFVAYNRKRNSITITLRQILNPRIRNTIESLYLSKEDYCSYWIKNIYNNGANKVLRK